MKNAASIAAAFLVVWCCLIFGVVQLCGVVDNACDRHYLRHHTCTLTGATPLETTVHLGVEFRSGGMQWYTCTNGATVTLGEN